MHHVARPAEPASAALHPRLGAGADEPWPAWLFGFEFVGLVALGVLAILEVDAQLVPSALVLAALVPWLACLAGVLLRPVTLAATFLVPIGILVVGAEPFGFVPDLGPDGPQYALFLLVVFCLHFGVLAPPGPVLLGVGAVGFAIPLVRSLQSGVGLEVGMIWKIAVVIALVGGFLLGRQARLLLALRDAQAGLVAEAAARERRRAAREVHDVIAHSLAVTMLHVTAARLANEQGRRDDVRAALLDAEQVGRRSLDEVRRTVALLRADGDAPAELAAPPGGRDVAALVAEFRAAGTEVDLVVDGPLDALDDVIGLTLYRVVQESLTNAARHAPGLPVTVSVTVGPDGLSAVVTNPLPATNGSSPGAGAGLIGMRERVGQAEGTLDVGPRDGTWHVAVTLPSVAVPTASRTA